MAPNQIAPNQIAFKAGRMLHFVAARSFALGSTGNQVPKGTDVYFDGTKAEVDGGEHTCPQLRGAIRAGWLVLAEDYDENDISSERPVRANIQVRHAAQGGNPMKPNQTPTHAMRMTESDEHEVAMSGGTISSRAAAVRQRNEGYRRGQAVNAGETVLGQHGFEVVEDQDGVEVDRPPLATVAGEKSKFIRVPMTPDSAGRHIRQAATSVQVIPGKGITEEEMLERMDEFEREQYLETKEALRSRYVDESEPAPRTVGRVKNSSRTETREGITSKVSAGGGIEVADPSYGGKAKESVIVEDGITFRTTNGPEQKVQPPPRSEPEQQPVLVKDGAVAMSMDVRRMVAKSMCPDFPDNYVFDLPDRKKIARLQADYEDRPDVLMAVYAAESDTFKAKLVEEFPGAFGK